jgi:hypothetical protein
MIAASMSAGDVDRVLDGLTLFSAAAGELPGVDRFGLADYVGNAVLADR